MSPSLKVILQYLTSMFNEGKAYRAINVTRSMLSSTLPNIDGVNIGKHLLVVQLMRGIYNAVPPQPRYSSTWDVDSVIDFLEETGPNSILCLSTLSQKLVMLLALALLMRVSEIAAIKLNPIIETTEGIRFSLSCLRKSQRYGPLRSFSLKKLCPPSNVCPVACLNHYREMTDAFRNNSNNNLLIICAKKPNGPASPATIARWLKNVLFNAGIDAVFSAHSTRGASASKAYKKGIPIDNLLEAAGWSSQSVFFRVSITERWERVLRMLYSVNVEI